MYSAWPQNISNNETISSFIFGVNDFHEGKKKWHSIQKLQLSWFEDMCRGQPVAQDLFG